MNPNEISPEYRKLPNTTNGLEMMSRIFELGKFLGVDLEQWKM